eukprot:GFUD01022403.1.p1 GENE.GFUD01022403.1~~GFUD01022403.1.p1  ORF type:complete len:1266 (+),score=266.98 GFUD01022403.1:84-3881(+)
MKNNSQVASEDHEVEEEKCIEMIRILTSNYQNLLKESGGKLERIKEKCKNGHAPVKQVEILQLQIKQLKEKCKNDHAPAKQVEILQIQIKQLTNCLAIASLQIKRQAENELLLKHSLEDIRQGKKLIEEREAHNISSTELKETVPTSPQISQTHIGSGTREDSKVPNVSSIARLVSNDIGESSNTSQCPFGYGKKETKKKTTFAGIVRRVIQDLRDKRKKPQTLLDWRYDNANSDILHRRNRKKQLCDKDKCKASLMAIGPADLPLPREDMLQQAEDFVNEYYADGEMENHGVPELCKEERMIEVMRQLKNSGFYTLTEDELIWGARTAWRNTSRCVARIIWKKLRVLDFRHISDSNGMFSAICEHLEMSLNGGAIVPCISVFRERRPDLLDIRVWNNLLLAFAGYQLEDGSIIGDPASVEFTELCQSLGWVGGGGQWDLLPLVLSGEDGVPHVYEIPEKYQILVDIKHPTIAAMSAMKLKWVGIPIVSNMMYEVGGLQFTAAPFSGWYQATEIANRDLLDIQRYNLLEPLGRAMGLDMSSNATMWKDVVSLELNKAVLYSYTAAGVSIVDHFTQAEQFLEHLSNEYKVRGGCPADWVWIVPPQSGALVPTFHQEMIRYHLSPSYEYQARPWHKYGANRKKKSFRSVAWSILFWNSIYKKILADRKKVLVLYGTETGSSKRFAKHAVDVFSIGFRCSFLPLNSLDLYKEIMSSDLCLFISSTFGNGEAPKMAESFSQELKTRLTEKVHDSSCSRSWFTGLHYGVFGLGSSAYPNLAAFGKFIGSSLDQLAGTDTRIIPVGVGDELNNQKGSFKVWIQQAFLAAIELFHVSVSEEKLLNALKVKMDITKQDFRWVVQPSVERVSLYNTLSAVHDQSMVELTVIQKKNLHEVPGKSQVLLTDLEFPQEDSDEPSYETGELVGICPANKTEDVEYIKDRLLDSPPSDLPLLLQTWGQDVWADVDDFPKHVTYNELLTYFVDLKRVPSQDVLALCLTYATDKTDREILKKMVDDYQVYDNWRVEESTLCETLKEFPSIKISSAQLVGRLRIIQNRLYSIASAPSTGKVSLVVGVVDYKTPLGVRKLGLFTGELLQAKLGTKIPGFFRPANGFSCPKDISKPLIMIAAGSGIAPFRGFWQERSRRQSNRWLSVGPTVLFYGCQMSELDLLKDETDQIDNLERHTALSRAVGAPRQYVQDMLVEQGAKVWQLWQEQGGSVYVCGKISMAAGVQEGLETVLQQQGGLEKNEAKETLARLRTEGRYQEDVFGI